MIWIICASICALLIALGIGALLNKKNGSLRFILVLGCLFAATYIIYIPVYFDTYNLIPGLIGDLIHVLQTITLDADIMDFYDVISKNTDYFVFTEIYMVLLVILHTSLPAISALTAVTVIFRCFSSIQLFFANNSKKPMFIFSEVNERSLHFAKSLENMKCHIVFAGCDDDSSFKDNGSTHSYIFKEEDITELKIKGKKGKEIYTLCISDDEDTSLSDTLQLIENFAESKKSIQKHIHIYHFSKYQDFSVFIDSADKGSLDVQCINEYEKLIYNLLDRYPLLKYSNSRLHVLLYGLSRINTIALKSIAWCGQLSGFSLKISVAGVDIQDEIDELKLSAPGLFSGRYNIDFYDCVNENQVINTVKEKCSDANYIIVSEPSDNATMNLGLNLRRLFYKADSSFSVCPPIFCYVKDPSKFNILKNLTTAESNPKRKMSYSLTPFGSLDEVYTYDSLIDSSIEKLSKNVHLAYEEIFSDGEIDVDDAISRYNIFEVNKRSNRANALHIRYKLNLLGLDYTDDPDAEVVSMNDCYTDEIMEKLSISEHDRWMAFLETEGWIPAEKQEVYAYRESGISKGRHNCPLLKMHPYICEYEKLKDLSLDLEGKDTTVYDTELILRIPDILRDKWNVSGKKYNITKLK